MKTFAIAALLGAASAFPSFDSFHAHCQIEVTIDKSCDDTLKALSTYVKSGKDEASPPGSYSMSQEDSTMVWATRTTANNKYTDDVMWAKVGDGSANTCTIQAKSKSKSLSYYDYSVNFCNMYNPLRAATGAAFTGDIVNDVKVSKCSYPATATSTCDRY